MTANLRLKTRNYVLKLCLAISVPLLFSCAEHHEKVEVIDLQCEYLINPVGIDIMNPSLSWKLKPWKYSLNQSAYRILVASNRQNLEENIGDLWDSDKVSTSQSIQIQYNGKQLNAREKVYWKVMAWDQYNKSSFWSEIFSWEMGLLNHSDWQARWIGKVEEQKSKVGQQNPAGYFRKSVEIHKKIKDARAYISGLGYYELYINGKKVGDHVLAPNQTNYDRRQEARYQEGKIANMSTRVLYETHDISDYLQQGENVFAVILGNGWYYQTTRMEYLPLYFDSPRFIAQIEMDYADNSKQIIVSDESWKNAGGPIIDNNLHHGEIYDARMEEKGWDKINFDDNHWEKSSFVRDPQGILKAQMSPPDRVVGIAKPVSISKKMDNTFRFDFGTMFSGWVKLSIQGKRGDEIKLTFFEDTGNTYEQNDTYILKGEGIEIWEPRFTWHAFRYVEISGASAGLTIDNVEGRMVNTDVKSTGIFESSNTLFNTINTDFKKTQLGNMHGGVPSDCPHRERRGYTGDGQIAAQAAIYNFDMQSFYTKWLNDIADAQNKKTGYIPNTVPYHSGGGGTPWGSAYIIIPWYMYLYYGDISIIKTHYHGMKHYLSYLSSQVDEQGLIVEKELGEWVPPEETEIPPSFVSSAYFYYDLILMSKVAAILGNEVDKDAFITTAKNVKEAFNKKYFYSEKASYSIGRQGANVFPLAFDLVPEEFAPHVFETLVQNVSVKHKGHFDTGMMGTPYLLEVLTNYGRPDLAYTVMNRRDFPSFGYNIERGATTLWESWAGNDSHSHPMFGSVCAWFFQGLGGINPDPLNPGFKHTIIKPSIVNELEFVKTTYPSVYGEIESNWELIEGNLTLHVTIPPNTSASIFVPGDEAECNKGDGSNVIKVGVENGLTHFDVASGGYSFFSKNIGKNLKTAMLTIPVIDPPNLTFFYPDTLVVNIRQYSKDAEIRYTVDGKEPNESSDLYTNPFPLYKSTYVKAKVFRDGITPGFTSSSRFVFIDSIKNGINFAYYIGAWDRLPDYSILKPLKTGKVNTIGLDEFEDLDEQFGILFSGELKIDESGIYTFYLVSNDGSRLYIDDKLIVNTDGLHSFAGKSGKINLREGLHKIKLAYFQAGGGRGLELEYEGLGIEKQRIPADILFFNN